MRMIFTVCLFAITIWCMGLSGFLQQIPSAPTQDDSSTDAIVVLTGGALRVERGFDLFGRDKAQTLFISGVGKDTTLKELAETYGNAVVREKVALGVADIVLDYQADSTHRNAREAAEFIRNYNMSTVRLVTANYHMPRSLMEFKAVLPKVFIIADPVMPSSFHREGWWRDTASRNLVLSEYHKYWAAWFRAHVLSK